MSTNVGKVYAFIGWVLFVALLVGVKYRRDEAYWQEVSDKIAAQMEPPKAQGIQIPDGENVAIELGNAQDGVTVVDAPPPRGVRAAAQAATSAPAPGDDLGVERVARKWGVLP